MSFDRVLLHNEYLASSREVQSIRGAPSSRLSSQELPESERAMPEQVARTCDSSLAHNARRWRCQACGSRVHYRRAPDRRRATFVNTQLHIGGRTFTTLGDCGLGRRTRRRAASRRRIDNCRHWAARPVEMHAPLPARHPHADQARQPTLRSPAPPVPAPLHRRRGK